MIISPGRAYIFVHIPKTGGTALATALEARAMKDDILIGDTPKALKRKKRLAGLNPAGRLWKHSTLADIHGLPASETFEAFRIVTLVRNPWDRIVSYYHWLRAQEFDHPSVGLARQVSFSAFLNHPLTQTALLRNPYAHYVTDAGGVERPATFARLEHWEEDLEEFMTHLGFRVTLERINASDRARDWRPYYTDEDAALVSQLCADDIARSGYRFDP